MGGFRIGVEWDRDETGIQPAGIKELAETREAVELYHRLSASKPTGALIHSTC